MKYKIHEAAKMMGVSPQTLRFYEQYGIQINERVGDGKYRQYSEANMDMLMSLRKCRNCGFSVAQASQVLRETDDARLCGMLKERAKDMQHQAELMTRMARAISATAELMSSVESRLDCFEERMRPAFCIKTILRGREGSIGQKEMQEVAVWADWLPIAVWFARCEQDDLLEGTKMERGFMLDQDSAEFLGVNQHGGECVRERACLYAVMRWNPAEGGVLACMRRGVEQVEKRGLRLTGRPMVKTIWNIDTWQMPESYGEFYFPID